jgi:hygromycin-B 4-O-kinase
VEIKPPIPQNELLALLTERSGTPVTQVEPIATGQMAKGFFFTANGAEYVIRFTRANVAMGLYKDQYAYEHFSSPQLPIPPVICVDAYQEFTYIITRKMPGKILDRLTASEYVELLPSLMETLDAIHQTDISNTSGGGSFNEQGQGLCKDWPEHLLRVAEEEDERWFYGKWHTLFDTTFLERDLFDRIFEEMKSLLSYCPTERFLVHADFGSDNALAEKGRITAVLDWANSVYGDFLFDVAWLDMWSPQLDLNGRFRQYYQTQNHHIPHYDERFRCCQCYIALDSFRFYAKTGQEEGYQWMRSWILDVLA